MSSITPYSWGWGTTDTKTALFWGWVESGITITVPARRRIFTVETRRRAMLMTTRRKTFTKPSLRKAMIFSTNRKNMTTDTTRRVVIKPSKRNIFKV